MYFKIVNQDTHTVVCAKARKALTFFQRLCGLMMKASMSPEEALIFYRARSIHTFFMRFPIDIIFLDKNMHVIRICNTLDAFRVVFCKDAFCTIECLGGLASAKGIAQGQALTFENVPQNS